MYGIHGLQLTAITANNDLAFPGKVAQASKCRECVALGNRISAVKTISCL